MVTLPLKASHKERRSVIRFLWAKQLSTNAIYSKMHPVYCGNYFTRQAIHVWCKKFAQSRESIVEKKQPGCRAVLTCVDRCNDCGSSFSHMLVKLVRFSRNLQCSLMLTSCERITVGKILH